MSAPQAFNPQRVIDQIQEQQNRAVAAAIRRFLNGLNFTNRFIDWAIQMEIKEAEWDPTLLQPPPPVVNQETAQAYTNHIAFLNGLLPQIAPNIHILWQALRNAGVTVSTNRVETQPTIPGILGATISDDLTGTLTRVGTAAFEPVKTLVNLLRHIKVLERRIQ